MRLTPAMLAQYRNFTRAVISRVDMWHWRRLTHRASLTTYQAEDREHLFRFIVSRTKSRLGESYRFEVFDLIGRWGYVCLVNFYGEDDQAELKKLFDAVARQAQPVLLPSARRPLIDIVTEVSSLFKGI